MSILNLLLALVYAIIRKLFAYLHIACEKQNQKV